jgi:hypothetical protein
MGFGGNPHVAKAEAAEAKAREAKDVGSEARAYLEAAHFWDRAAAKEQAAGRHHSGGAAERRAKYEANAVAARERSSAATEKPAPSAVALEAQLKVLRGDKDG